VNFNGTLWLTSNLVNDIEEELSRLEINLCHGLRRSSILGIGEGFLAIEATGVKK
jgi:hypothetical protein